MTASEPPTPNYDESLILDSVDRFLERDVRPHVRELEENDVWPEEIVGKMKELGLFGATIGEEYGGLGLSASTYTRIVERVSAVWMSVSGIFNSHLIMAAAVERFGTEAQKRRYLPRCASGELRGAIALTEPDCGTDLQGVRTRAELRDGRYVVNGAKTWITNSVEGNILAALVKTDPAASPPHRGMSLLIVEKGFPGFGVVRKLKKIGYRGIDTGELVFDDCEVPRENPRRNRGGPWPATDPGRSGARPDQRRRARMRHRRACLEESVAYAQVRKTFGKPICEHQSIQIKLAEMATRLEASRLLTESAARAYDTGERCDMEAGMAKLFATETALFTATEAMRIHGAYGYSKEFNIERYYRDAPLLAIGEGTNELQRLIIAKQLVKRIRLEAQAIAPRRCSTKP